MDLADEQWEVLAPLIPDPPRPADGRGRPWRGPRDVLDSILWVLRTGRRPLRSRPSATHHTRPATAAFSGGPKKACSPKSSRRWPRTSRSAAASTSPSASSTAPLWARKGGGSVGKTKRGKGTKLTAWADASGLPPAVCASSASAHEVTLVEATLAASFAGEEPERGSGPRLGPARRGPQSEGHRDDRTAPEKQEGTRGPGRAQPQALQAALAGRSSACSPGRGTSVGWWCATSGGRRTTSASSCATSFC